MFIFFLKWSRQAYRDMSADMLPDVIMQSVCVLCLSMVQTCWKSLVEEPSVCAAWTMTTANTCAWHSPEFVNYPSHGKQWKIIAMATFKDIWTF